MLWRSIAGCTLWAALAMVLLGAPMAHAQGTSGCDSGAVAAREAEFKSLVALKRFNPPSVTDELLRAASLAYVEIAESCYTALTGSSTVIDDGPLMPGEGLDVSGFQTSGAKWGMGTLYAPGVDVNAPRLPGGTVTYSFMGSGVPMGTHSDASLAVSSLPGFQACFLSEIRDAFAAWSAVANIQFVEVPDNGVRFDGAGAKGDIRIGAHTMDGQWGVLAHAFFPPPGGVSAAGDMHFDRHEVWSCTPGPGVVDIGIVAAHEIGHAIGLNHETRVERTALMNPYYNPNTASILLADDVAGAAALYGLGVSATDDLLVNFGQNWGLWELDYGTGWRLLHGYSPRQTVSGDLDGNGVAEQVVAFENPVGIWVRWNESAVWSKLHGTLPASMLAGDFNGNGRTDVAIDFAGYGVWIFYDGWFWSHIMADDPSVMSVGNVDGFGGQDIVMTRPGAGVWVFLNSAAWIRIHPNDADVITAGALDAPAGPSDVLLHIPGAGIYQLTNFSSWTHLAGIPTNRLATAQLDGNPRGEIVADFGPGVGLWINWNGAAWTQLHSLSSDRITVGDLDGTGRDDVVIRFKQTGGLWMFVNGTSWFMAHGLSPADMTVSDVK